MTEIKVDRQISFYEKYGEKHIGEISINEIPLKDLTDLISVENYKDDYLLYDCYFLDKVLLDRISVLAQKPIDYDLERFQYYLEATAAD